MKAPQVKPKNVPEALREIDSWILWRLKKGKKADGSDTWLKVPYWADGTKRRGALGTKEDRAKLVSFDKAMEVYLGGNYAGVGFATMPEYPLTILDLDKCVDKEGNFSQFASDVIDTGTYVEYSPSMTGLRAVFVGEAICAGKRNGLIENGERVEIYCGSAFVTITGHKVSSTSRPKKLPPRIRKILEPVATGGGWAGEADTLREVDGEALMSPDAAPLPEFSLEHARKVLNKLPETWGQPGHGTWYRVAAALHLQFDGSDEAYQLLDEWSQGLDGYDEENNRKRWAAGFSHAAGKSGLTTMRNLVFEARDSGGLRVKPETMQKWGLARKSEPPDDLDDIDVTEDDAALPEYSDLAAMSSISPMLDEEAPPIEWLIEDFLPRGVVTTLAGPSGTSKSFLMLQACAYAAVGMRDFAGLKIKEGGFSSMYFFYEDPKLLVHRRIRDVSNFVVQANTIFDEPEEEDDLRDRLRSNLLALTADVLDNGDWQFVKKNKKFDEVRITKLADYLRGFIQMRGLDLLVFDTGSETHAVEENNAPEMVVLMRVLRQLASSTNIAVLVIQHVSKTQMEKRLAEINQGAIRGSSVLVDKSRNVFYVARMPRLDAPLFGLEGNAETNESYVVLKHLKANMGEYVKMRVFERAKHGLLLYLDGMQERDEGLTDMEENEQKTEREQEKRKAEYAKLMESAIRFVQDVNDKGEMPAKVKVTAFLIAHEGVGDKKANTALDGALIGGKLVSLKTPGSSKRMGSKLVVKGHALHKQAKRNGDEEESHDDDE